MLSKADLIHTVTIIKAYDDDICHTGTAFFVKHKDMCFLVSNKHVIDNCKKIKFPMPIIDKSNGEKLLLKNEINIQSICHIDYDIGLVAIDSLIDNYDSEKYELNIKWILYEDMVNPQNINIFSDIEDVLIIGYPCEIMGDDKCYPIVKHGITATSIFANYDGKQEFLTDIINFSGSSGSPVFVENGSKYLLVGIHRASLQYKEIDTGLSITIKSDVLIKFLES